MTPVGFDKVRSRYPGMIFPMIWYQHYLDSPRIVKELGTKLEKAGHFVKKGKRNSFCYPLEKVKELQENCFNKISSEKDFLPRVKEKLLADGEKLLTFVESKKKTNFSELSDEELLAIYNQYNALFTELNYFPLIMVHFATTPLIKKVQEVIPEQKDVENILKSATLPYLLQYELEMLKGEINDAEKLHQKWFWIPFDYYGADEWDQEYFISQLKKEKDLERLRYLENYETRTKLKQEEIVRKYNLNDQQIHLLQSLQIVNFIQDERKKITNMSYPFLQNKIMAEFSKRTEMEKEILWLMTPEEIARALAGERKDFRHRKEECAIENHEGKFVVHETLPDFLREENEILGEEIKGVPASGGIVRGKVRICNFSKEIEKMEPGEILVAPSTTPDFILGFKKAIAVVTEEGGLTSHAAVVSREMNLPCLIGVKKVSERLKDGDLVEVDANKGVVKILNENKNINLEG